MNGSRRNRNIKQTDTQDKRQKQSNLERGGTYSYGGVLRGSDECLAVLTELTVQHSLSVPLQSGQKLPRGHLQHLEGRNKH